MSDAPEPNAEGATTGIRPSTAAGVAWLRAAHQLIDSRPLILEDPAIVKLLEPSGSLSGTALARAHSEGARALRAHVVLRSRFAEDQLAAAVARGVTQYIILGAGFDTFAVRQPEWARGIRVIEVDRPELQRSKIESLARANLVVPDNVRFAPIDFERETLAEGLARNGVSLAEPSFFSWLGVTMYLTEPAIDAVLRTVATTPPGSEIVFTFAHADRPTADSPLASLAERAASVGEPWITYFTPEQLEAKLRSFGFATVEFLSPREAYARYFDGRADGLPAPRRGAIVSARISA